MICRFDFYDELFIDHHVDRLPSKWLCTIKNCNRDLAIYPVSSGAQLQLQCKRVDVFPESEPELFKNFKERSDHSMSERLLE